jgi:hypothetical protein
MTENVPESERTHSAKAAEFLVGIAVRALRAPASDRSGSAQVHLPGRARYCTYAAIFFVDAAESADVRGWRPAVSIF